MPHLNRAVNDPLLPGSEYQPYSYLNPVIGEHDLDKTLDLNSLFFSLDDFQKLSKGTYNAGEFRLTDSGKLDIVNNHKTWTVFNQKPVDGADSFAIRVAFARAMSAGGLDKDAMKPVLKALGLRSDYSMRSGKALLPLTRQEVRKLIDENIGALNARRSANNQLKNYDQLHASYSTREKEDIIATREEINRTGSSTKIHLNNELSDVITVIKAKPSFKGMSEEDAKDYLEFIDEISTALERLQDQDARSVWMRENRTEYKVTVVGGATGLAIALNGGDVVVETVTDGKRSRIDLGLTPDQLQKRLDNSYALLNEITHLDVDDTIKLGKDDAGGDDLSDDVSQKAQPRKSNPSGNILNEPVNQDDDLLGGNILNKPVNQDDDLHGGNILNEPGNQDDDLLGGDFFQPDIRQSGAPRKGYAVHDAREIEKEPSPEDLKLTAKKNLDTLASLIADFYGFSKNDAAEILMQVEGWEDRLAHCRTAGNPTSIHELDGDLGDFLLENRWTIQPLIEQYRTEK